MQVFPGQKKRGALFCEHEVFAPRARRRRKPENPVQKKRGALFCEHEVFAPRARRRRKPENPVVKKGERSEPPPKFIGSRFHVFTLRILGHVPRLTYI